MRLSGQYFDTRQSQNNPTHQGGFDLAKQFFYTRNTTILTAAMVNQVSLGSNDNVVDLGLGNYLLSPIPGFNTVKPYNGFVSDRLPQVSFTGGWSKFGISRTYPLNHASDLENTISDDWSWLHGNHMIEVGFNLVAST